MSEIRFLPVDDPEEIERMERNDLVLANAYLCGKIDFLTKEKRYSSNPGRKTELRLEQLKSDLAEVRHILIYPI